MCYIVVICDFNDFIFKNGYDLCFCMYNWYIEFFIVIIYYNEDKVFFLRIFYGVMQNIRDIVNLKKLLFWNWGGFVW